MAVPKSITRRARDVEAAQDGQALTRTQGDALYAQSSSPASAVAAHEAASNPHPTYLTQTEGDALYEPTGGGSSAVSDHEDDLHGEPASPSTVTLLGSPHTYANSGTRPALAVVAGGTVTLLELSHNGSAWVDIGVTAGAIVVATARQLRITYAVAPTVTIFQI